MNILITTAGRRVSLVRAFQHEVNRVEENSMVLTVDARPELSPCFRVSHNFYKGPKVTELHYFDILTEYYIKKMRLTY